MTLTRKKALTVLLAGLAGSTACTVGDTTDDLIVTESSDAALRGQFDPAAGPRLEFEVLDGELGPTARVLGESEGTILRVERDIVGEPIVWVGAVPLDEAVEDASSVEVLRVAGTADWSALAELLDAIEGLDAAPALVGTLREGMELAADAIAAAAELADEPRTQQYSSTLQIYGCMNWYQARNSANSRCQSYGYSYAASVWSHGWTRCGTDSYGYALFREHAYICYRGSSW